MFKFKKLGLLDKKFYREKKAIVHHWLEKAYNDAMPYIPPVRLDISITSACNTKCPYCWQQKKSNSLLTFENVVGVIDAMCFLGPPKLTLSGGEPTVWPDFERLIAYAKGAGITKILLCTNGLRLCDFQFAERIVNLGITDINISVDTFDPERFKVLRGYSFSVFNKILSNCILLKKRYQNLTISLCSVMSKAVTPEELFEVKKFCDKNNFGYFMQTFDKTEYEDVNKRFILTPEEKQIYHQKLTWLDGIVAKAVKRTINPLTESDSIKCYKGITTVKLSSDGLVSFCWKSKPIGNILKDSFIDIWTSPKAREMRKFIREKKCKCVFDCDVFESLELYEAV